MTHQPRIPDPETRARSVARMRETIKQWDVSIANLDELNTMLEAENNRSFEEARQRGNARRKAAQIQE
ncbi:hypothetical protein H6S82_18735 [Planktothrix sp. FACHB-1355]|uniref:Uncharacterized protein n=1 Tax=Aerosakkonema funiforme FACHB-1375 TaxID=2949571 RepID=A0A926ZFC1_9CYAN|nr:MULTISPECIES: hypothetical protein [Oscillatoriales]MBD2179932.1 hypothetical protein [Aerosakkonema funiforme FACHB-1375]MBD3560870.1 hypothetical protein [Planktothrix sp. FACHB-1355]